jgi:2-oxoglutarate dehydrogenase E2 component (dihydrolipoamide succinyltransferase)
MIVEIKVPSPGESITEVQIARWLKKEGDVVEKDEELCEIDSDKATLTVNAEEAGQISILAKEGDTVKVGDIVCKIDTSVAPAPKAEKATQDELRQIPGMATFFASSHGNAMKNDYYELREEVASAVKSLNFLKDKSPAEAQAYIKEKMPLLQLQGPINNINNQLTKIRKYEEQIRSLPESRMNSAEKKVALDRIKESEDRMLKNVYRLRNMAGY